MGYNNVESMDGGWKGWLESGSANAKIRASAGPSSKEFSGLEEFRN